MNNGLPDIPTTLNTSNNDLATDFFEPCLRWADRYDRAVGFFTSGWLSMNARGMSEFASRNGKARWITSPILDSEDLKSLAGSVEPSPEIDLIRVLSKNIESLRKELERNTRNVLAWMIHDGILEFAWFLRLILRARLSRQVWGFLRQAR